jgi:hypothetical protein
MTNLLPDIYLFNPTCEYAVANGSANWQPNHLLQKMEADLSALPMFFAKKEDYVLVDRIPSAEFIKTFKQIDIEIPNFITKKEAINNSDFINLPKNKLLPWGWSPSAHKFLLTLKESCSAGFQQSPVFIWKPEHREITSRKFALGILKQLQSRLKTDYILSPEHTPKVCTTKNDFETVIQQWEKVMIKAPWSSSGRGLQPITKTPVHPKVWEKVMGIVKEQGYAVAEPLFNKVHDIAFLFELKKGKVDFLGISIFCTNKKGQYEGNYLNGMPLSLEKKISEFSDFAVDEIRQPLINAIKNSELATNYEGFFGVDMLIYLDVNNKLKINPCLEINVRHTMGLLALRLEKIIRQNKKGFFGTFYQPGTTFLTFKKEMENKYPLKVSDRKIVSGFLALTEAGETTLFGAYLLI